MRWGIAGSNGETSGRRGWLPPPISGSFGGPTVAPVRACVRTHQGTERCAAPPSNAAVAVERCVCTTMQGHARVRSAVECSTRIHSRILGQQPRCERRLGRRGDLARGDAGCPGHASACKAKPPVVPATPPPQRSNRPLTNSSSSSSMSINSSSSSTTTASSSAGSSGLPSIKRLGSRYR